MHREDLRGSVMADCVLRLGTLGGEAEHILQQRARSTQLRREVSIEVCPLPEMGPLRHGASLDASKTRSCRHPRHISRRTAVGSVRTASFIAEVELDAGAAESSPPSAARFSQLSSCVSVALTLSRRNPELQAYGFEPLGRNKSKVRQPIRKIATERLDGLGACASL